MLLRCGLLFDGTSSDVRSGATIRIKGDRIASVARDDGAARPGEAVVDLRRYTVLPGLVDAHDHLGFSVGEPRDRLAAESADELFTKMTATAQRALEAGITTVRDLGERRRVDLRVRAAIEAGYTPAEALRATTADGAEACGVADRAGRIAPGYAADVIAVEGNPLESVEAVGAVAFVMRAGQVYLDRTRPAA